MCVRENIKYVCVTLSLSLIDHGGYDDFIH